MEALTLIISCYPKRSAAMLKASFHWFLQDSADVEHTKGSSASGLTWEVDGAGSAASALEGAASWGQSSFSARSREVPKREG